MTGDHGASTKEKNIEAESGPHGPACTCPTNPPKSIDHRQLNSIECCLARQLLGKQIHLAERKMKQELACSKPHSQPWLLPPNKMIQNAPKRGTCPVRHTTHDQRRELYNKALVPR